MLDSRHLLFPSDFPAIRRRSIRTLQVNLGFKCNQSCNHCHVNAGPSRTETMSGEVLHDVIGYLSRSQVSTLDITGGAPELHESFKELVLAARSLDIDIIDHSNQSLIFKGND